MGAELNTVYGDVSGGSPNDYERSVRKLHYGQCSPDTGEAQEALSLNLGHGYGIRLFVPVGDLFMDYSENRPLVTGQVEAPCFEVVGILGELLGVGAHLLALPLLRQIVHRPRGLPLGA